MVDLNIFLVYIYFFIGHIRPFGSLIIIYVRHIPMFHFS